MKKIKKITALFIVCAVMASVLSFAVSAQDRESSAIVNDADIGLAIKLEAFGAITNEFKLDSYVTRGEMAGIVAKYGAVPAVGNKQIFSDVTSEHTYFGAVGALFDMGIISGDENGNFNPNRYVTYDEALVFIINMVGHKPFAVREGGYPTGYHRIAVKFDMLSDLSMNKGTDKATVSDIYKMLDKAFSAAAVVTTYYGDDDITYTLSDTETFLSQTYKIDKFRGVVTGVEGTRLASVNSNVKEDQIEINKKIYDLNGYGDYNLLGMSVDFYVSSENDDLIIHLEETHKMNERQKIDADDLLKAKTTDTRIYYTDEEDDEYHIDFDSDFDVIYNSQSYNDYGVLRDVLPDNGYIEALDNNRDGDFDVLFIYSYKNIVIESIDTYDETVCDEITGNIEDLSDHNQIVNIRFVGQTNKLTFESLQVGDVVTIAESKKTPKVKSVYISRYTVSGRIEACDSDKGFYIGGNWYEAATDALKAEITTAFSNVFEGKFYLDLNGEIAYYDNDVSEISTKVAVMSGIDYEIRNFGSTISVRLFTQEGEFLYAELKEKVKIGSNRYDLSESQDVTSVLSSLASLVPGGGYEINSAYVVGYTLDSEGKISYLDLGNIGGPGKLNSLASGVRDLLVRINYICSYTNSSGEKIRQRYDSQNGVAFGVPSDGDLENLEGYSIYTITQDHHYWNNTESYTYLDELDIYTYQTSEYPMIDVLLFHGAGAGTTVSSGNRLDVIENVTSVNNADGETTCKLYMGNNEYVLSPMVYFSKGGATPVKVSASSLATASGSTPAELRSGIAVQFTLNSNEEITALRVIAEYDDENDIITPLFGSASTYLEKADFEQNTSNVIVGTVSGYDPKTKQLYFTTTPGSTQEYMLYTVNDSVVVYRSEKGIVTEAKLSDIAPGDKIVAALERYYVPKNIILFK